MSERKPQAKAFDPLERVVTDSLESGFFSGDKLSMQKLIDNCRKRGLVGVWTQQSLSKPLTLFVKASERMTSEDVDILLSSFAKTINFDTNLIKQHFYAIYQGWEKEFLKSIQTAEIAFEETTADEESEVIEETADKSNDKQPKEKPTKEPAATAKGKQQES